MEMEYLRWILLGVAIILVVAVYFFSRARKKDQYQSPLDAANDVPSFRAESATENEWMHGVGPVRVVSAKSHGPTSSLSENEVKFSATEIEDFKASVETENTLKSEALAEQVESVKNEIDDVISENNNLDELTCEDKTPGEPPVTENSPPVNEPVVEQTNAQTEDTDVSVDDVISVYVLGQPGEMIKGEKILSASYALNLDFGAMKIFHRHDQDEERKIQFSMANIKQPGWFDIDNMHELETPGVSFFMQVNLVDKPSAVLDEMLITAHGLSSMIEATLCGAQRKPLDEAQTNELREKVKYLENLKSQSV
ncbi:MAG: cell division protein ZipA [Gammaproteobacteria bacterium]|nr:cell division protein ZipA [Gammaproteobacteria bacterium]